MKNVLVTGASGDIGGEIAREFIKNGYNVIGQCFHNGEALDEIGGLAIKVRCDVTDTGQVNGMFAEIRKKIGRVDILVNNAGVQLVKMLCDTTPDEWNTVFNTNLFGAYNCTKAALEDMMYGGGKIINISSVWGQTGGACESVYSASKAGLEGFTKALAKEYGNINVNCVAPGVIASKMNARLTADEETALKEEIPLKRFGTPFDVAQAVLYLANADYVTGQIIAVNGGMYI